MTILITGSNGFVGTNLSLYLKDKYRLWALSTSSKDNAIYERIFSWDKINEIPMNDVDAIIHLAGMAHDTKNQTAAKKYFDINVGLTQTIYNQFLQSNTAKFIFFSSVKAAADNVVGDSLTEDIVPNPKGPYGESKIAAENYILAHQPSEKQRTYILRPCMIHGPGNKGNLNLLFNVVCKGIPYPLGEYENRRTFTSIENLCFIIENLLVSEVDSGIYNIGDDESLSTIELIRIIAKTIGNTPHIWKWNKNIVKACASIGSMLHLPFNTERLNKLTENYVVCNKKIKQALNISQLPITAQEGLHKTILSFI